MIDDKTIDVRNAKYWCVFQDDELSELLKKAGSFKKEDGKKLADVVDKVKKDPTPILKKDAKVKKESMKVDEGIWDWALIANLSAFPLATGNPFVPNFRGMDPSSGVPSLQDQGKNSVIAAAASAALVGGAATAGGWGALGTAIAGALGTAGSYAAGLFASATAAVGTAGIAAIVGGLVSVSTYLYPRIAKLVKDLMRSKEIAVCKFEADGTPYKAVFALSKKRWELLYDNSRWIRSGTKVSPQDISSFFKSLFFKKFASRCWRMMDAVYNDAESMKALETLAKMADKKSGDLIKQVIDAKDLVNHEFKDGMFVTEADKQVDENVEDSAEDMLKLGEAIAKTATACKSGEELLAWGNDGKKLDKKLAKLGSDLMRDCRETFETNFEIVEDFLIAATTESASGSSFKAGVEYGVWQTYLNGLWLGLKHKKDDALSRWLKYKVDDFYDLYEQMTGY